MDKDRQDRIEQTLALYRDALDDYAVPLTRAIVRSRERLGQFIGFGSMLMIDRELEILERRLLEAQKASTSTTH